MTATLPNLYTIGDLADHFGCRRHVLVYAVREAGVEPAGRVGITRLWTEDQLPLISEALNRTAAVRPEPVPA